MLGRWFEKKQDSGALRRRSRPHGPARAAPLRRLGRRAQAAAGRARTAHHRRRLHLAHQTSTTSPAWAIASFSPTWSMTPAPATGRSGADEDGKPIWNVEGFLDQALNFSGRMFDVVLLWTALDYLPEALVAPGRRAAPCIHESRRPGARRSSTPGPRARRRSTAAFMSPPATTLKCSWRSPFPSSAPLPTAASKSSSPAGRAIASSWPRTASLKSS